MRSAHKQMATTVGEIVSVHGRALLQGTGTYFLGSGISAGSGLPDWFELMKDLAAGWDIRITRQDDLARIAQYCINGTHGNRGPLVGRLKQLLSRAPTKPNAYHAAIARTNLATLWTTNYDTLLEEV